MSSSSLIFSMGAISIKVIPVFVFILIIASSLAIHLSTYIQPSYWLWGVLKLGSYHGPHTFSWGVFARCHGAVWSWAHIMALIPSHEVSPPVVMRWSEHGLISWPSHLLLTCLCLSSWDGLNLNSYDGPHTFHPRCLCLSSWDGLNMDSYHGPHTFSWCVSAYRHETVWTWTHITVLTPFIRGVSACRHETVWKWTHIMVLTPSPEMSPSVVMRRFDLGLVSWPTHLLPEVSPSVFMRRFVLELISWPTHLLSKVSPLVVMRWSVLGLISWPTHLLSEVSPLVVKRSHPPSSRMSPVTLRFSTTMWT